MCVLIMGGMDWPILCIAVFLTASIAIHLGSLLIAALRLVSRAAAMPAAPLLPVDVSIVRPLCGMENFLEQTLRSTYALDHARYEVLFCVAHASDPAIPLARRLIDEHPAIPSRLLIGNSDISANPKLNNMVKGWDAARGRWIVMADSNVMMPRDTIARLFSSWRRDTGMVCSPPLGASPDGVWAELECAFLNTYQARWQFVADSAGLGFAQGKTMLWHKDLLNANGGIVALASEIAEDAAATKLVRRAGLRVRLIGQPLEQPLGRRTAAEVWRRQLRWARLRRATFPALFSLEIFAGAAFPLVSCALLANALELPAIPMTLAFAAAWYSAEALLARTAGWHCSAMSPLTWLLRDLMLPAVWVGAWTGNSFQWRGNMMRLEESRQSA